MPKKHPQIATFVFFDIETTGLPFQEKNQTKIIEYSLVAVLRKDLEIAPYGEAPASISKLTSVLNPKKPIGRVVTQMTGLSRKKLSKAPTFGEKFQSIKKFLEDLPAPICLISHNGNSFDFRILLAECNDISASLPANLYCVDSLIGFRTLLMGTGINYSKLDPNYSAPELLASSSTDNIVSLHPLVDPNKPDNNTVPTALVDQNITSSDYVATNDMDDPIIDENTELENVYSDVTTLGEIEEVIIDGMSADSDIENQENNVMVTETKNDFDKKQTFVPETGSGSTERECFKLTTIYKRLLNKEPAIAHRAEDDCLTLMYCVVAMKSNFLPWADKNCQLLSKIKPINRRQTYWRRNYRRFR